MADPAAVPAIDPVCAFHGLRRSEHHCLYCCICFRTLTPDECVTDAEGERWDVCRGQCAVEAGIEEKPDA